MLFLQYPKCTTCQRAKQWLDEAGLKYTDRHIKENPPTLEELREMDGEPVFLDFGDGGEWAIVRIRQGTPYLTHKNAICNHVSSALECGGKVYRRKPEGGDRNA